MIRHLQLLATLLLLITGHSAKAADCPIGTEIQHSFSSGASWEMCVLINARHGLEFRNIAYRAPGDTLRSVLRSLHIGEALLHYHEDSDARSLLSEYGLGAAATAAQTTANCAGAPITLDGSDSAQICSEVEVAGILKKYAALRAVQIDKWTVAASSNLGSFNLNSYVTFFEDGRISPGSEFSGRAVRFTDNPDFGNHIGSDTQFASRASLLYTWRMDFALNTDEFNDILEEHNHILSSTNVATRPLQVTRLETETFRDVDRENFRGWRIRDENGSGYYLDPQNNGYSYLNQAYNWAQFDLAVTASEPCEQHASNNVSADNNSCGESLDEFVNNQSLLATSPIMWFSLTRHFNPSAEDFPAISTVPAEFELLPFDWTNLSPFEQP